MNAGLMKVFFTSLFCAVQMVKYHSELLCIFDNRFSSHYFERSSSSSTRLKVYFDECNIRCRTLFIILWWRSSSPNSSGFLVKYLLSVFLIECTLSLFQFIFLRFAYLSCMVLFSFRAVDVLVIWQL